MNTFSQADALIVVDMQNSFLHSDGIMWQHRGRQVDDAAGVIDRNRRAVEVARAHDVPVVYTRHCHGPDYLDAGPSMRRLFRQMGHSPLLAGSWDADLVDDVLEDAKTSPIVDKTRMDAFVQTDLEVVLRGLNAIRLLVCGIVTNACVETTARAAAQRDFEVALLGDCCGTYSPELQSSSLYALEFFGFAHVVDLDEARRRPSFVE
jgi:ureidoacrylate peracid hydrolase